MNLSAHLVLVRSWPAPGVQALDELRQLRTLLGLPSRCGGGQAMRCRWRLLPGHPGDQRRWLAEERAVHGVLRSGVRRAGAVRRLQPEAPRRARLQGVPRGQRADAAGGPGRHLQGLVGGHRDLARRPRLLRCFFRPCSEQGRDNLGCCDSVCACLACAALPTSTNPRRREPSW